MELSLQADIYNMTVEQVLKEGKSTSCQAKVLCNLNLDLCGGCRYSVVMNLQKFKSLGSVRFLKITLLLTKATLIKNSVKRAIM